MRTRQCEISVARVNILTSVLNAAAGLTASALRQSTRRVIRCLLPVCVCHGCVCAPEQRVRAWSRALVRVGVVWVPTHNARAHAGASTVAGRASGTHVRLAAAAAASAAAAAAATAATTTTSSTAPGWNDASASRSASGEFSWNRKLPLPTKGHVMQLPPTWARARRLLKTTF
jgi:hypothetical protein